MSALIPISNQEGVSQYQSGETSPKADLWPNNLRFARHPFLNECNRLLNVNYGFLIQDLTENRKMSGPPKRASGGILGVLAKAKSAAAHANNETE